MLFATSRKLAAAAWMATARACAGTLAPMDRPAATPPVRVTVLTTTGCGQTDPAVERVTAVAARLGIEVSIDRVVVETAEDANRLRLLGSPTIQLNGRDLDPSARDRTDFGLG
jgi:hypothetical protein